MSANAPARPRVDVPEGLARLAWLCTVTSALILAGVLAGNALLLAAGVPSTLWLLALVDIGPLVALFLGNVATFVGYYGTWRILRGLDAYSAKDDAKNQLLQVPGMLQDLPQELRRRFGCMHALSAATLAVSLVVTGLTLAPPPLRVLGAGLPSDVPSPTATRSPGSAVRFIVSPTTIQQQCNADGHLDPTSVTLDNTEGTADGEWQASTTDTVPGLGIPWASVDPSGGIVSAGARSALTLMPSGRLCPTLKQPQTFTLTVTLVRGGAGSITIADTIAPAPRIAFFATPADTQWSCFGGQQPPVTVTLDNSGSTVAVAWQVGRVDPSPKSVPWATVSPESGTVSAGATQAITVTPDASECSIPQGTQQTYTISVISDSGATLTISNTVTQPIP